MPRSPEVIAPHLLLRTPGRGQGQGTGPIPNHTSNLLSDLTLIHIHGPNPSSSVKVTEGGARQGMSVNARRDQLKALFEAALLEIADETAEAPAVSVCLARHA